MILLLKLLQYDIQLIYNLALVAFLLDDDDDDDDGAERSGADWCGKVAAIREDTYPLMANVLASKATW